MAFFLPFMIYSAMSEVLTNEKAQSILIKVPSANKPIGKVKINDEICAARCERGNVCRLLLTSAYHIWHTGTTMTTD